MRQLRVVGLSDDGETVIVEDPIRHERFSVPGDERLRAAARGDVRRLGQMEIEHTSPLRPRDIQARIRAGESVEQVATGGGVSIGHVERFAYPVLLERARVAEMAGRAHPLRSTEPERQDPRTLGEIVSAVFVARGQDYDEARWDARKGDDAQWTVVLSWQAGRSDNTASWTYRPGASGGVVLARDDHARDLVGEPVTGPRRVDGSRETTPEDTDTDADGTATPTGTGQVAEQEAFDDVADAEVALAASGDTAPARPDRRRAGTGSASGSGGATARGRTGRGTGRTARGVPDQRDHRRAETAGRPTPGVPTESTGTASSPATGTADAGAAASATSGGDEQNRTPETGTATTGRGAKARRNHPIVPSWEDVLLGTRSPRS